MARPNEEVAALLQKCAGLIAITSGEVADTWPLEGLRRFRRAGG